jgi:hypothetical protein
MLIGYWLWIWLKEVFFVPRAKSRPLRHDPLEEMATSCMSRANTELGIIGFLMETSLCLLALTINCRRLKEHSIELDLLEEVR